MASAEAALRLAADGVNELVEGKRIRPVQVVLAQFKSLIVWILIGAGVLSGILGDWSNLVFRGTSVAAGTGQAVLVATPMNTELARIAGLLQVAGADEETPLQKKLDSVGRILVWPALYVVTLLFVLGLLRGGHQRCPGSGVDAVLPNLHRRGSPGDDRYGS